MNGTKTKQHLMPDNHWYWSMTVPAVQGWHAGDLIFVGGQISADEGGRTVGVGDVDTQTRNVMRYIENVLNEAGAGPEHIVKLNTYVSAGETSAETAELFGRIGEIRAEAMGGGVRCATDVGIVGLAYPDLILEIEAIAVAPGVETESYVLDDAWRLPGCSSCVCVGDLVFVGGQISADASGRVIGAGDIATQTRTVFENLRRTLGLAGATMQDIVKFNTYYVHSAEGDEIREYWERMTNVRMEFFEEPAACGTGVRVPMLRDPELMIQVEAVAVRGSRPKQRLMPENHWYWSIPVPFSQGWRAGDLIFVGGQISSDEQGRTVGADDIETQTRNVFDSIARVLGEAGATMQDIVRMNTFYVYEGEGDEITEYWEKMTKVRMEPFRKPGPSGTGVRISGLAYPDLLIEVEAVAYAPL
jgi:enamine deaminase RidA (YjgF/YER057c/UK114 family)